MRATALRISFLDSSINSYKFGCELRLAKHLHQAPGLCIFPTANEKKYCQPLNYVWKRYIDRTLIVMLYWRVISTSFLIIFMTLGDLECDRIEYLHNSHVIDIEQYSFT